MSFYEKKKLIVNHLEIVDIYKKKPKLISDISAASIACEIVYK